MDRHDRDSVFLFVGVAVLLLALFFFLPLEQNSLYAQVEVGDNLGFDVNTSALIFGRVGSGVGMVRSIIYKNDRENPVLLSISAQGEIADLLSFRRRVVVPSGESVEVTFEATAGSDVPYGVYSGWVTVKVYRRMSEGI